MKTLTIGIATHGNYIAENILELLSYIYDNFKEEVDIIISEDKEYKKELNDINYYRYIYSDNPGIENNRQNILNNTNSEFIYIIDNDDSLNVNMDLLINYLKNTNKDLLNVVAYEDGKRMHINRTFMYMCSWMQIYRTSWIKNNGGYIQSWNFIHEEFATDCNLKANTNNYVNRTVIPKKIITYNYHANGACNAVFNINDVCKFIENIPSNDKIKNKKKFYSIFNRHCNSYLKYYRINKDSSVSLNNIINGSIEDVYICLKRVKEKIY